MLKYPRGGLGGPPSFVACLSISVVVIELWAVEAFVLRLLLVVSSSWLLLSMLEMQVG
jgi:hypothetical protein